MYGGQGSGTGNWPPVSGYDPVSGYGQGYASGQTHPGSMSGHHLMSSSHVTGGPNSAMPPPSSVPYSSSMSGRGANAHLKMRQQEKKLAAELRRQEQKEREREMAKGQDLFVNAALFKEPEKMMDEDSAQVAKVLGRFSHASSFINSRNSCIGIDYQPPTPAPAMHSHIIGDDDDDLQADNDDFFARPASSNAYSHQSQLHSSLSYQQHATAGHLQQPHHQPHHTYPHQRKDPHMMTKAAAKASDQLPNHYNGSNRAHHSNATLPLSSSSHSFRTMPPPPPPPPATSSSFLPPNSMPRMSSQSAPYSVAQSASSDRLKSMNKNLPKLSIEGLHNDSQFESMLREMQDMPIPLSAIQTPVPSAHMGNSARFGQPKYMSMMAPPMLIPPLSSSPPHPNHLKDPPNTSAFVEPTQPLLANHHLPAAPARAGSDPSSAAKFLAPCLSEESDSDHDQIMRPSKSCSANLDPVIDAPSPPRPLSPLSSSSNSAAMPQAQQPSTKSAKYPASSSNDTSSTSSSFSSSSDEEDEEEHKKTTNWNHRPSPTADMNHKLKTVEDDRLDGNDNDYSLTNLLGRVKSHSPSTPHLNHQSPKNGHHSVMKSNGLQSTKSRLFSSSLALDEADEPDAISSLLSHTPQPIPDLEIDGGRDLLVGITQPLSPIPQSPPPRLAKPSSSRQTSIRARNDSDSSDGSSDHDGTRESNTFHPTASLLSSSRTISVSKPSVPASPNDKTKVTSRPRASSKKKKKAPASGKHKDLSSSDEEERTVAAPIVQKKPTSGNKMDRSKRRKMTRHPSISLSSSSSDSEVAQKSGKKSSSDSNKRGNHNSSDRNNRGKQNSSDSSNSGNEQGQLRKFYPTASPRKVAASPALSEPHTKTDEVERSNNKKTAISMIFAGSKSKVGCSGKNGIKVEVYQQGSASASCTPPVVSSSATNCNSVRINYNEDSSSSSGKQQHHVNITKSSSSSSIAHLGHPDAPCGPVSSLIRRRDGRPMFICKIPMNGHRHRLLMQIDHRNANRSHPLKHTSDSMIITSNSSIEHELMSGSSSSVPCTVNSISSSSTPLTLNDKSCADLMPPPNKRVFYSYLEQRRVEDEEFAESDYAHYMGEAKRLKREADAEVGSERKAMKYLNAVLYFTLCGNFNEVRGEKQVAFTLYKDTLDLVNYVCKPFQSNQGHFDIKLAILSLRCQSLLYLRLYKLSEHELKECQKILGDHLQKAESSEGSGGAGSGQNISPTPSPAGSEGSVCSKSSGYTSASEFNRLTLTPPSNVGGGAAAVAAVAIPVSGPAAGMSGASHLPSSHHHHHHHHSCLSVPRSVMQKQHQFCSFLSQCHDLWERADQCARRGHCEEFVIQLDRICGPLTLHSSLKALFKYIKCGLDYLQKEKEGHTPRSQR